MPQRKSGIKALRQNRKRRLHNLDLKSDLKRTIKGFQAAVTSKDKKEAATRLKTVFKKLDKMAKHNLIHKNTVARRKSGYSKSFASLA